MISQQNYRLKKLKFAAGVSLIELILVFAVVGNFLILGFRFYQNYKQYVDIDAVKSNVDVLFIGMQGFYKTNCYGQTGPDGQRIANSGLLNPLNNPPPSSVFPINIENDLVKKGYIVASDANLLSIFNPYVDSSAGENGFIAQFNKQLLTQTSTVQRQICLTQDCSSQANMGEIYVWQAQISIKLNGAVLGYGNLVNLIGADCLSALAATGKSVMPCSANQTGEYAVFTRLPSGLQAQGQSTYWSSNPTVMQFTQMYNTNSILLLTNGSMNANQYFLCTN